MIALLRSTDGQPDSRFEKYVGFLSEQKVDPICLCWDRLGVKRESHNRLYYKKPSSYGMHFGNVKNLIGFNVFLLKKLIKRRQDFKVIHAADFDTILPAIFMKIFFRKKVIYDIYDWYIDSRGLFKSALRFPILWIEFLNIKLADMVIICEPEREGQILFKSKNLQVLPNIPFFKEREERPNIHSDKLHLAYVGILGESRGLENLIVLAKTHPNVIIEVGGFGNLEKSFEEASNQLPNLTFHGRMDYKNALEMMSKADLIYAIYERTNPNHILAAPNKYYEGLYLGKPIITTTGTLVGDKTEKYNTGYCIDENVDSLLTLFDKIKVEDILDKSHNAAQLWKEKYKNYVIDFMQDKYLPFIKGCYV